MDPITVTIKHMGKQHSLVLDPSQPPRVFKETIQQSIGVPVDQMKVMIKGGTLQDDNWGKPKLKEGMNFTVIGTTGELPKPPETKTLFSENMTEEELAKAVGVFGFLRMSAADRSADPRF